MTTNYIHKLGPALIRPGRVDFCLELTYCDRDQIIEMTNNMIKRSYNIIKQNIDYFNNEFEKFPTGMFNYSYDDETLSKKIEQFADSLLDNKPLSKIKPCELQVYILKYIENIDNIFDNYRELLDKETS